jgi:hypothetical protein
VSPSFLLGIEADVDGTSLKGSVLSIDGLNQHSSKLDGTVRGRVEFAQNKCLFAPGGFAWSEGSVTRTQIAALALSSAANSRAGRYRRNRFKPRTGWSAGINGPTKATRWP